MDLQNWLANDWLIEHKTTSREIADLLAIVDRDLENCRVPGLSPDWKLAMAYNAALQAATAALAASGYRATRESHHYRVIKSLALTIGAEAELITQLDQFRKKRNITDYERPGTVSEQETREIEALAKKVRQRVLDWLNTNHPHLLRAEPKG